MAELDAKNGSEEEEEHDDKANERLHVDSTRIQTTTLQHGDDDASLGGLGLRLYDQHTLEAGLEQQMDEAVARQEARRQKQRDRKQALKLGHRIGQLRSKEKSLSATLAAEPRTYRDLMRQKRLQDELGDVRTEIEDLKQQLEAQETGVSNQSAATLLEGAESELDKRVRLGQITPFGTELLAPAAGPAGTETSSAVKPVTATAPVAQNSSVVTESEGTSSNQSQNATVQRRNISNQSRKVFNVTRPSTGLSDDEYVPSDEMSGESDGAHEESDQSDGRGVASTEPRNLSVSRGKKRKRPDTDSKTTRAKAGERARRRVVDDGDPEEYAARIRSWRAQKRERRLLRIEEGHVDEEDEDERSIEFEGGYRCPELLWDQLFKYQQVCVRWLWELHQQQCGGILGDEMGLGKTVQIIAFLAGLSRSDVKWGGGRGLGPVLIMAPATVLHQWVAEFHKWWPPLRVAVLHDSGSYSGSRSSLIRQLARGRGVLVTSYSAMTSHKDLLVEQDWHYVVLDEGHKIRNPDAQITLAVKQLRTPHRLILSGSPLQNNLRELWSLLDFVFPGKLGTLPVFMAQFAVPITQGGYTNASDAQVVTAFRCAKVLRDTIAPYLLRRMKADVQQTLQLPAKNEQVLFCKLTDEQKTLYQDYINSDELRRIMSGRLRVFVGLVALRKICNHPDLFSGTPPDTGVQPGQTEAEDEDEVQEPGQFGYWRRSGKLLVLSALLKIWHRQQQKVLLFTQSRQMLTVLEALVSACGYSYLKMDGTTAVGGRQKLIHRFNTEPELFVFLLTTRVGGLGVNLTGANRVVIYDPDWNPSTDQQARERAWRIGQERQVTIYRLLTAGTIEEKIYHRQIFKQFLTNRVLKDPKQQRFFKTTDLHDLFTLTDPDAEEAAGTDGARQTETAEIFSGSQVSAAALEKRRQHRKLKQQKAKEQKRRAEERARKEQKRRERKKKEEAEKKRLKLLEQAKRLNKRFFKQEKAGDVVKPVEISERVVKNGVVDGKLLESNCEQTDTIQAQEKATTSERSNVAQDQLMESEGPDIGCVVPSEAELTAIQGRKEGPRSDGVAAEDELSNKVASENAEEVTELEEGEIGDDSNGSPKEEVPKDMEVSGEKVGSGENGIGEWSGRNSPAGEDTLCGDGFSIEVPEESLSNSNQSCTSAPTSSSVGVASSSTGAFGGRAGSNSMCKVSDVPSTSTDSSLKSFSSPVAAKREGRSNDMNGRLERKKKSKKRRHRRRVDGLGEVEGLVDSEVYRPPQPEEATDSQRQDDYVLARLFKKSGIHSAVRHDVIEGHGTPDSAILEAEATQVAREAVAALRASRREVRAREVGVPTWTGQSGRAGRPGARPRFGQKKNPLLTSTTTAPKASPAPATTATTPKKTPPALPTLFAPDASLTTRKSRADPRPRGPPTGSMLRAVLTERATAASAAAVAPPASVNLFGGAAALGLAPSSSEKPDESALSSGELLQRIRRRADRGDDAPAEVSPEHADLLADIRNFVAFQSDNNGRASTKELLARFKARLPPEQTPLFKALLNEICEFERGGDRVGWWVLREELR